MLGQNLIELDRLTYSARPRESGDPAICARPWIPACAGMSGELDRRDRIAHWGLTRPRHCGYRPRRSCNRTAARRRRPMLARVPASTLCRAPAPASKERRADGRGVLRFHAVVDSWPPWTSALAAGRDGFEIAKAVAPRRRASPSACGPASVMSPRNRSCVRLRTIAANKPRATIHDRAMYRLTIQSSCQP